MIVTRIRLTAEWGSFAIIELGVGACFYSALGCGFHLYVNRAGRLAERLFFEEILYDFHSMFGPN